MHVASTGIVTFPFNDIESSTRFLQRLGERYPEVLAEHRRLRRASRESSMTHPYLGTELGEAAFGVATAAGKTMTPGQVLAHTAQGF